MAPPAAAGSGFLAKFLRPQLDNVQAASLWGVAAGTAALYLVQPFDFIRKTFFEKSTEEK